MRASLKANLSQRRGNAHLRALVLALMGDAQFGQGFVCRHLCLAIELVGQDRCPSVLFLALALFRGGNPVFIALKPPALAVAIAMDSLCPKLIPAAQDAFDVNLRDGDRPVTPVAG